MRLKWTLGAAAWAGAILISGCASTGTQSSAGSVDRFEIVSTTDAYGGAVPAGAAGPYTVITGVVHGRLDPLHPDNAVITDLVNAAKDKDGLVSYSTDVVILRPKHAADAKRVLFYDVVNRGLKRSESFMIGSKSLSAATPPGEKFPSLLRHGYTVVWSGWQGGIAQSGAGATSPVGTRFPVARKADGSPITALSREEYIQDVAGSPVIQLSYPPASLTDRSEVSFTARQSWLNAAGQPDYASPSVPVTEWRYEKNDKGIDTVRFQPPRLVAGAKGTLVPPDAGTIYSFVYRAQRPTVNGVGFAAVRDLLTFLRYEIVDAHGNPNPLNDMKKARCVGPAGCVEIPASNFDATLGLGLSQSGRFLREFLYLGFNKDHAGRRVFDGLMPLIAGARRTWANERFSQIGRWSRQHEDHWMPGDQFPFTYGVMKDPVSGRTDGLMLRCQKTHTCPKIMQVDGSFEWWGGRGSLVVTDGTGQDIELPRNVRYYLISGTQHGGGSGVSTGVIDAPGPQSLCVAPTNPVSMSPVYRALVPALERWVTHGVEPPPSRYPTVSAGQAVLPDAASYRFPKLDQVSVPLGQEAAAAPLSLPHGPKVNQLFVTDYAHAVPVRDFTKAYTLYVPRVDETGNETAGILMPEVQVPLGTYTGWNVRRPGHSSGESCSLFGAAVPLARSLATKSPSDPRKTLDQLYAGRGDYIAKVGSVTNELVEEGFIDPLDAAHLYMAGATKVSPALISAP